MSTAEQIKHAEIQLDPAVKPQSQRLTENELSDFSRLWHDGCVEVITEAQDVDRNHSSEV